MKPLLSATLQELETKARNDKTQTPLRRALYKNQLPDLVQNPHRLQSMKQRFSLDLKTLPVNHQKQSGRCWLFAGLNVLREMACKTFNVTNIEFSQNYVAFYDKLEKINYFLQTMNQFLDCDYDDRAFQYFLKTGIQDGGQWDMFVSLVEKYGIVVKDAMEETASSSNTRPMNQLINTVLRNYAAQARALFPNLEQIARLREQTFEKLYLFLTTNFGFPPQQFDFEYLDKDQQYHFESHLTPLGLLQKIVKEPLSDYLSIIHAPTQDKPTYQTYTVKNLGNVIGGQAVQYLNLPLDEFKALILAQLQDREAVWFGADVGYFGDRSSGLWDDQAYDYQDLFGLDLAISKADSLRYAHSQMNHAMVFGGVNLIEGIPTKWKIENSWGDEAGVKGYFVASDSWFDRFVYQAVIHKKYLNKEQLQAWQLKPILLKPWDPMGSLAVLK